MLRRQMVDDRGQAHRLAGIHHNPEISCCCPDFRSTPHQSVPICKISSRGTADISLCGSHPNTERTEDTPDLAAVCCSVPVIETGLKLPDNAMPSLFGSSPQHFSGFREDAFGAENHQTVIFQDLNVAVRNDESAFPPDQQDQRTFRQPQLGQTHTDEF